MTAAIAHARPARPAEPQGQAAALTRHFLRESLRALAMGLAIGVLASGILYLVFSAIGRTEFPIRDEESGEMVVLSVSATWVGVPLMVAFFTALVMVIVMVASHTRVAIASGATRRNLLIAYGSTIGVLTAVLGVLASVVYAIERAFHIPPNQAIFDGVVVGSGSDSFLDVIAGAGVGLSVFLLAAAVAALFLRFPWWVGVGLLVLVTTVIPIVGAALGFGPAMENFAETAWPPVIGGIVGAAVLVATLRDVRVP